MERKKFEQLVTTNNAVPLTGGWMVFNDLEMFNLSANPFSMTALKIFTSTI